MTSSFYTPAGVSDKPWWDPASDYHYYTTGTREYPLVLRLMIPADQRNMPPGLFSIYTPHPTPAHSIPQDELTRFPATSTHLFAGSVDHIPRRMMRHLTWVDEHAITTREGARHPEGMRHYHHAHQLLYTYFLAREQTTKPGTIAHTVYQGLLTRYAPPATPDFHPEAWGWGNALLLVIAAHSSTVGDILDPDTARITQYMRVVENILGFYQHPHVYTSDAIETIYYRGVQVFGPNPPWGDLADLPPNVAATMLGVTAENLQ